MTGKNNTMKWRVKTANDSGMINAITTLSFWPIGLDAAATTYVRDSVSDADKV